MSFNLQPMAQTGRYQYEKPQRPPLVPVEVSKVNLDVSSNRNFVSLIHKELKKAQVKRKAHHSRYSQDPQQAEYEKNLLKIKYQLDYQHPSQMNLMMFNSDLNDPISNTIQNLPLSGQKQISTIRNPEILNLLQSHASKNSQFTPISDKRFLNIGDF